MEEIVHHPPHPDPDRAIARVAAAQHGTISRSQLLALGVGRGAISYRLRHGALHPLYTGVYLVGHPLAPRLARAHGALLACGPKSLLSHLTAASLWGLVEVGDYEVDVTVVGKPGSRRRGIRIHRTRRLSRADVRLREGLALTAPARTLLDLAEVVDRSALERAASDAIARRRTSLAELEALVERSPGRRGVAALSELLRHERGPALTRSEAERRLLALIRQARLPEPAVNTPLHGHVVDFLWPAEKLVVEVDGYRFHSSRRSFERDRERDSALGTRGYEVMRVTWRQLIDEPEVVLGRIALRLGRAQSRTPH